MATIKFSNGKVVKFDGTPTQADIDEIASTFNPTEQSKAENGPTTSVTGEFGSREEFVEANRPSLERVDELISTRPSRIRETQEQLAKEVVNPRTDVMSLIKSISPAAGAEKILQFGGAGLEALESIPANIGLGVQRGKSGPDIMGDVLSGISGERPAQIGDIPRSVGVPDPISALLGLAAIPGGAAAQGHAAKLTFQGGKAALTGVAKFPGKALEFFKGNPKLIKSLNDRLSRDSQAIVQSFRREGSLNKKVFSLIKESSDRAWAPVREVTSKMKGSINKARLSEVIDETFPDNIDSPGNLSKARHVRDRLKLDKRADEIPIKDALKEIDDLSASISKASKRGTAPRTANDVSLADTRTVITNAIDELVDENLSGAYAAARNLWAQHATFRNRIFKEFQPTQTVSDITTKGERLLESFAKGKARPSDVDFIKNLEKSLGVDLTKALKPTAERVSQLEGRVPLKRRAGIALILAALFKLLKGDASNIVQGLDAGG